MTGTATLEPLVGLRASDGTVIAGPADWAREATTIDESVLDRARGPVLDIGCGPGRHALALAARGVPALGIDVTPVAIATASQRGAAVLERSVFDRIPAAGRWNSALLLDGNIGIGGHVVSLLARVAQLLRPGGVVLAELARPGARAPIRSVRLEIGDRSGPWFPWAQVAADEVEALAAAATLTVQHQWRAGDRFFAALTTAP